MSSFTFEIRYLSNSFYSAYPHTNFPEILEKDQRPYTCLFILSVQISGTIMRITSKKANVLPYIHPGWILQR